VTLLYIKDEMIAKVPGKKEDWR